MPAITDTASSATRAATGPVPRLLPPRRRNGHTHEFNINGLAGHLTITELADGRPGEVFLVAGKQGSTLAGLCEALSITTSLALQHHVPVNDIVRRLRHMRFEPAGSTGDHDVPEATSLADYLACRLAAYLDPGH
jgi:ribonucleoside-diphosphate reductase alpha chain